jgi:hypothetical protein
MIQVEARPTCMDGPGWARGFEGLGDWSGAVIYSAFGVRLMTAGRDGCRGSGSQHCGALVGRDDGADCSDQGPDHFAVAFLSSLLSLPSIELDRRKRNWAFRSHRSWARGVVLARGEYRPGDCAVLAACAITATFIGRVARVPRCHWVARSSRERALRMRVTAPRANSLRSRLSPCRLSPRFAACRRRNSRAGSCPSSL